MKAKYFRKNRDSKNSISFTDAKKIVNLSAYVMKDADEHYKEMELISSLSDEKREMIPQWLTKNAMKLKFDKGLEEAIENEIIVQDDYGRYPNMVTAVKSIIEYYLKANHAPPTKMKLFKLLLMYHPEYTIDDYLQAIGFLD